MPGVLTFPPANVLRVCDVIKHSRHSLFIHSQTCISAEQPTSHVSGSGLTLEMCRGVNLMPAFQGHVVSWQGEVSRCVWLCAGAGAMQRREISAVLHPRGRCHRWAERLWNPGKTGWNLGLCAGHTVASPVSLHQSLGIWERAGSASAVLGWGWRLCIPSKLPAETDAAGRGPQRWREVESWGCDREKDLEHWGSCYV